MDLFKTIGNAALLTVVWFVFVLNASSFRDAPPRANVVPYKTIEVDGGTMRVPDMSSEAAEGARPGRVFMSEERYQEILDEFNHARRMNGILAAVAGIAVFVIGTRLFGHWGYGVACLVAGPLVVAFVEFRRSRLM